MTVQFRYAPRFRLRYRGQDYHPHAADPALRLLPTDLLPREVQNFLAAELVERVIHNETRLPAGEAVELPHQRIQGGETIERPLPKPTAGAGEAAKPATPTLPRPNRS